MEVCSTCILTYDEEEVSNISDKWDPYLTYKPLKSDCSDEELNEFFPEDVKCIVQCVHHAEHRFINKIH